MPTLARLNERDIRAVPLATPGQQVYYTINGYPKLGLIVGPGSKTFIFRTKK
jgi:hypothetical protein